MGRLVLLPIIMLATLLSACGDGGWFGSPEKPTLPGERISILTRDVTPQVDAALGAVRPGLAAATDGAWPQPYGDAAHAAGHRALADRPTLAWSADIGEGENGEERRIVYPPVASDTAVFALDAGDVVSAWSIASGQQLWRVDPKPDDEEDGFGGGLALDNGVLYFATGWAEVIAFDAATGAERWRTRLVTPSRAAPTVQDGRVYAVTIDNRVIALDAESGRSIWIYESPPATASLLGGASPAAANGALIAAMTTGEIVAFRAANGRITWDDSLTAVRRVGIAEAIPAVRALPVIVDGRVFAIGAAGFMAGIDFATGVRLWDKQIGGAETPAVSGGFVYLTTDAGALVAVSADEGLVAWATDMKVAAGDISDKDASPFVRLYAGPVAAGGNLIVVRGDGQLLFFRPEDGVLAHQIALPGRTKVAPIIANRTLFVLTEAGVLQAYR